MDRPGSLIVHIRHHSYRLRSRPRAGRSPFQRRPKRAASPPRPLVAREARAGGRPGRWNLRAALTARRPRRASAPITARDRAGIGKACGGSPAVNPRSAPLGREGCPMAGWCRFRGGGTSGFPAVLARLVRADAADPAGAESEVSTEINQRFTRQVASARPGDPAPPG